MNEVIQAAIEKRDALYDEARKWDTIIRTYRELCDHDNRYTGHGHNYDCYKCARCGLETTD